MKMLVARMLRRLGRRFVGRDASHKQTLESAGMFHVFVFASVSLFVLILRCLRPARRTTAVNSE